MINFRGKFSTKYMALILYKKFLILRFSAGSATHSPPKKPADPLMSDEILTAQKAPVASLFAIASDTIFRWIVFCIVHFRLHFGDKRLFILGNFVNLASQQINPVNLTVLELQLPMVHGTLQYVQ